MEYNFVTKWVPGKNHHIADALSRAPLFAAKEGENMASDTARACLVQPARVNKLQMLLDGIDADYIQFCHDVVEGTSKSEYSRIMKAIIPQLSVDDELVFLDAKRIIIPRRAVRCVLKLLHVAHVGVN